MKFSTKKNLTLLICLAFFSGLFSIDNNPQFTPTVLYAQNNNSAEAGVTFIELGSVKCIPCKMMQPVMEAVEKDFAGKVKVIFYDVWTPEGQPYAEKYGIQGIPTQIFLDKNGKEFFRHTGFFPQNQIEEVLEKQGVKK